MSKYTPEEIELALKKAQQPDEHYQPPMEYVLNTKLANILLDISEEDAVKKASGNSLRFVLWTKETKADVKMFFDAYPVMGDLFYLVITQEDYDVSPRKFKSNHQKMLKIYKEFGRDEAETKKVFPRTPLRRDIGLLKFDGILASQRSIINYAANPISESYFAMRLLEFSKGKEFDQLEKAYKSGQRFQHEEGNTLTEQIKDILLQYLKEKKLQTPQLLAPLKSA